MIPDTSSVHLRRVKQTHTIHFLIVILLSVSAAQILALSVLIKLDADVAYPGPFFRFFGLR